MDDHRQIEIIAALQSKVLPNCARDVGVRSLRSLVRPRSHWLPNVELRGLVSLLKYQ
jgi:hypothetical protein